MDSLDIFAECVLYLDEMNLRYYLYYFNWKKSGP